VLTGHDQGVAFEHRPVIEEGHDVGIGVDDMVLATGLVGDYGAEGAVAGHRRTTETEAEA
jgi:hypothetical protein